MNIKMIMTAAVASMLAAAACTKGGDTPGDERTNGETIPVAVSFSDTHISTRGYFDDMALTREWEREIKLLNIYVYDSGGNHVSTTALTSSEIEAGRVVLRLPKRVASTKCGVYVMANCSVNAPATEAGMLNTLCTMGYGNYNGNMEPMLNGKTFRFGFPMSGKVKVEMSPVGNTTQVRITLKRIQAKIALEYRVSPDFAQMNNGAAIRINSVCCGLAPDEGYIFEGDAVRNTAKRPNTRVLQPSIAVDGWYRNLWYMYERGVRTNGDNFDGELEIRLSALFDGDGNFNTTGDQDRIEYLIPVDYLTGRGNVRRNTCYRISATITGVNERNLRVSWESKDWVTPTSAVTEEGR